MTTTMDPPLTRKDLPVREQVEKTIPVSEIFGPTLEGEGPWAGLPTYFLRIGGCDFSCAWCDTGHAVNSDEVRKLPRLTPYEIIDRIGTYVDTHPGPNMLAISGGNPGLYDLSVVVNWWHRLKGRVRGKVLVETQGSRWQPWFGLVNLLTVSPKAPSSGMTNPGLQAFMEKADEASAAQNMWTDDGLHMIFKVVVFDEADYQFARELHLSQPAIPFHLSCGTAMGGLSGKWVPPDHGEHRTPGHHDKYRSVREYPLMHWSATSYVDTKWDLLDRYQWLAERAMSDPAMADVQIQAQLHCLLWGIETRGV